MALPLVPKDLELPLRQGRTTSRSAISSGSRTPRPSRARGTDLIAARFKSGGRGRAWGGVSDARLERLALAAAQPRHAHGPARGGRHGHRRGARGLRGVRRDVPHGHHAVLRGADGSRGPELPHPAAVGPEAGRADVHARPTSRTRWPRSGTCRCRASRTATPTACSSTRRTTARCTAATAPASARWPTRPARRREQQIEGGLKYIEEHPEIRDIVICGGDPLSLSDERLDYILGRLRAIPHVEIFRLGTRNLVTLPQRITDDFVDDAAQAPPGLRQHPLQPPARVHRRGLRGLPPAGRRRLRHRQPDGAAQGRQRRPGTGDGAEPQAADDAGAPLLHLPVRSVAGDQPLPHADRDRASRSSRRCAATPPGWRCRTSWSMRRTAAARSRSCRSTWSKHEGKKWTLRNYAGKQFVYEEP